MPIGKLAEFDVKCGTWSSYWDRLEMYFKANSVEEAMKLPTLIASMGDEAYQLLENLASPSKPKDLTLVKVDELMRGHLQPSPSALAERYRFRQRRQNAGENISAYVAELKRLSKNCKFAANLNENLRDQFICGLISDLTRQRLFAENDSITFVKAVSLATSLEAAERDAAEVDQSRSAKQSDVHTVNAMSSRGANGSGGSEVPRRGIDNKQDYNCAACGARSHNYINCRFRNYVCSKCQNTGHLRRVCPHWGNSAAPAPRGGGRQRGRGGGARGGAAAPAAARAVPARGGLYFGEADREDYSEEYSGDIEENLNHLCLNNYKSVSLPITIDSQEIIMEIDTGTAISCVSKSTYDKYFSHLCIESDNTVFKFFDGSKVKPIGIIRPWVSYNDSRKQLELFVISGSTATSLLGRQWLAELGIEVPKFKCNYVSEINNKDKVTEVVNSRIPEACRARVLETLHEPHMGIVKTKALARSYVWWAGIDEAVEAACRACRVCAAHASAPPSQAPRPWPWPARPWTRLHVDYLGPIYGKLYLVVVDAMSKWIEVFQVPSTAASHAIEKLSDLWARWGIPKQVVSDNGPPFTGKEFEAFLAEGGVTHILTAPYHPSSNGAAENAVKTIKNVIKKAYSAKTDIQKSMNKFLLYYRNTEHCSTGECPAVLLMGRRLRTPLDLLKPDRSDKMLQAQRKQVETAGGADRELAVGDEVWYRQYLKSEKWLPGKVSSKLGNTDYSVIEGTGNVTHKHIEQLKRRTRSSLICPSGSKQNSATDEATSAGGDIPSEQSSSPGRPRASPAPATPTAAAAEPTVEDAFLTPLKSDLQSTDSEQSPPDAPNPSPVSAQPRPIRKCRLDKPPRYKW